MAKGRTTQPLVIVVAEQWEQHPAIAKLRAAGHHIFGYHESSPVEPDLILHPAAHNWSEPMFIDAEKKGVVTYPFLEAAVTAARARKKGAKK